MKKTTIPATWGAGGAQLTPSRSHGQPSAALLLRELQGTVYVALGSKLVKEAADGAANTATAEQAFHCVRGAGTVSAVKFAPSAALTADATNNATLTIARRRAGVSTTVATLATDVAGGNWTAWIEKAFTLQAAANLAVEDGDVLTFAIAKAAAGVVVPAGVLTVDIDAPTDTV